MCSHLACWAALPALESGEHGIFSVTPQAWPQRTLSEAFVAVIKVTTDSHQFAGSS